MGRIEWFRRWRYDESIRLAEDQELLQRSYRMSRFANLPQIVLGYREERITLGGLSKLLRLQYVCTQLGPGAWRKLRLLVNPAARFAANCVSVPGGRTAHGSSGNPGNFRSRACEVAQSLDAARRLVWAAMQRNLPAFLTATAGKVQALVGMKIVHVLSVAPKHLATHRSLITNCSWG